MDKLIFPLILFAIAGFAIYKMVTVKPHKLVKEHPFAVHFRDDIPSEHPGKELWRFCAKKIALIPAFVLFFGALFSLFFTGSQFLPSLLHDLLQC